MHHAPARPGSHRSPALPRPRTGLAATLIAWLDVPIYLAMLVAACAVRVVGRRARESGGRRHRALLVVANLRAEGTRLQMLELLNRLPATVYKVDLLTFETDGGDVSRWLRRDVEVLTVAGWPGLTTTMRAVRDLCRERDYDIVHTWRSSANSVAAPAATLAGVPVVIASVTTSPSGAGATVASWWHRPAAILAARAVSMITVNARALVAEVSEWARVPLSRIDLVHDGLDPSHFVSDRRDAWRRLGNASGAPAQAVFVGTVGPFVEARDHATFVRILAAVGRTRPDVHGVIVGDGAGRSAVEALARELGIGDRLTVLSPEDHQPADVQHLMAGLDLFVLASPREAFSVDLLRASFLGVPCVATDIPGHSEVLAYPETVFPVGDSAAGAARVIDVLGDRDRTDERTKAVRQRALELFTPDRSVSSWVNLYRRGLGVDPQGMGRQGRRAMEAA